MLLLLLSFFPSGGDNMFVVNEDTGWILTSLKPGQSYEDGREYILSVFAEDISSEDDETNTVDAAVYIYGGTHPPQFTKEVYEAEVDEESTADQE